MLAGTFANFLTATAGMLRRSDRSSRSMRMTKRQAARATSRGAAAARGGRRARALGRRLGDRARRDSAISPTMARPSVHRLRRHPALAGLDRRRPRRPARGRRLERPEARARCRAASTSTRATTLHGRRSRPRVGPARREAADPDQRRRRHQHRFAQGALMMIDDHINLMGSNPLVGPNDERFGLRFPDMSEVYSTRLRASPTRRAATSAVIEHGVYIAVHGPSYETPAEIRAFRDARRRRGRHVHRARGDRRAAHGHRGARHLVHHQHGAGRAAAAAASRRSHGDARRVRGLVHRAARGHH